MMFCLPVEEQEPQQEPQQLICRESRPVVEAEALGSLGSLRAFHGRERGGLSYVTGQQSYTLSSSSRRILESGPLQPLQPDQAPGSSQGQPLTSH